MEFYAFYFWINSNNNPKSCTIHSTSKNTNSHLPYAQISTHNNNHFIFLYRRNRHQHNLTSIHPYIYQFVHITEIRNTCTYIKIWLSACVCACNEPTYARTIQISIGLMCPTALYIHNKNDIYCLMVYETPLNEHHICIYRFHLSVRETWAYCGMPCHAEPCRACRIRSNVNVNKYLRIHIEWGARLKNARRMGRRLADRTYTA